MSCIGPVFAARLALSVTLAIGSGGGLAQTAPAGETYTYTYETPTPPPARPAPIRELFAQTLSSVVQSSLSAVSLGVTELLVGRISSWFSRRAQRPRPIIGPETMTGAAAGQTPQDQMVASAAPESPVAAPALHVGLAYEIMLVMPDGHRRIVDPASHVFMTGDRILLELRPAQPGWLDVVNVDPSGRTRALDSRTLAAGELLTLGPYEFVDVKGADVLRLVLSPCSSPQLTDRTRSLVNVAAIPDANRLEPQLQLVRCSDGRTRSAVPVVSRSIRKVEQDEGTSFALDPVGAAELASGQLQAREVQIVLQHR
ncbi:MAG: hypothetical protein R3F58_01510 [Steroidobacteraceae bacterium]|nr:hypothetical protein [Steroidobacteraceae bacterium]